MGDRALRAEAHAWLANRSLVIPTPVGFVKINHAELPFGASADGQDQQMATTGNNRHA